MSENIDGGLGFVATLDLKDFNVSAEAMERRIRKTSNITIDESAKMENSIQQFAQNGARYIIGTLVGGGMMSLVNSIVQTRGQFQQLNIAFETMLGSGSKANMLMDQIVNTAARTPFDLLGLANGAKQLMAYGTEASKVNDILVRLGNIASGLSIPLNDIVYLYGTTMVQGRLYANDVRQFTGRGIPLVKELAAMYGKTTEEINNMVSAGKIGFSDVEKVLNKLTDSGGQFYNLMEKQSKSLSGMVSNLSDAWDNSLNKLGEQNQDILAAGISGVTYLAEHLDDILRIVKSITIAYGSYKAAIVLNTLATKGYTGVTLIDNTVKQAKIAILRAEEIALNKVAIAESVDTAAKKVNTAATVVQTKATLTLGSALKALWITMKANPWGWLITLAGMAYSAFSLFSSKTEEVNQELSGMAKVTKIATENFTEEAGKIDALQRVLNNSNASYQQRNEALMELKKIIPDYNAELTKEGKIINDNTDAINKYLTQLEKQIKLKAAQEELEAAYKEKRSLEKDESAKSNKYWDIRQTNSLQGYDRSSTTSKLSRLFGMESESTAKKDLDQTRAKLSEVKSTISELNKEISTTSLEFDNLNQIQKEIDSENSINKRIKDLQDERAAVEVNSEKYKELTKLIQEEQNKLPKIRTSEETLKNEEQLTEKQKESFFKLEQARIEAMEDGFGKRKALLDLHHKQTINSIEKEERELDRVRRSAGKGGLSSNEKQLYSDRKLVENQMYRKESKQLIIEEISHKKTQYQQYINWVKAIDKDTADKRFSNLLKEGSSYKEYLERLRNELNIKKGSGSFSDSDSDFLYALNLQYNEITGSKNAMDLFKESLSNAVAQAANLAERIEAIAQAKEKLSNKEYGLINEDENAEAYLFIEKMDADNQKALQETIIKEYRTFEQKKLSIQKEYSLLKQQALKDGNTDALQELQRGENEALSRLNVEILSQTDEWRNLFNNLDALTVSQISNLINKVNSQMSDLSLQMNPADLKAILERLQEAEREIVQKNPFKALSASYSRMIKAFQDLHQAKKDGLEGDDLQNFEQIAKQSAQNVANAIGGIKDILLDVGDSLSQLANSFGEEDLSQDISFAMEMVNGLGDAATGVAKMMAGDLMGGLKGVITGISTAISSIFNQKDKRIEKKIQSMQNEVQKLQNAYERLQRAIEKTYSNDIFNLMSKQEEALKKQKELIEKQIQAEKDKKKTDNGKIKEWEDQLEQIDVSLEESRKKQIELLAGTDVKSAIDEFADALVDAYSKGEDAAEALGEVTRKTLANAVKDALKRKFLADEIEKAVNGLADAIGDDGVLSEKEQEEFENIVNGAGDKFSQALEAYEKLFKDMGQEVNTDSLKGAIKSMSEETGGVLAGRLNAIVINQADSNTILRQSLLFNQEIAANTRYNKHLEGIHNALIQIKNNNGGSLLSQGIS
ncbi:MAG: tape measure protein [Tannerellaceae bacterium]